MNVKVCLRNGMFDRISVGGPRVLLKHALPALGRAQYVVANPPWGAVDSPATRSARRGRNVSSRLTGADGRTARPPGGKIAGPRSAHDRPASREGPRKSGSPRGDHRRDAAGTRRLTGGLCGGTRTLFICGRERRGGGAVVSARSRLEGDHGRGRSRPLVRGDRRLAARPGARRAVLDPEHKPRGYGVRVRGGGPAAARGDAWSVHGPALRLGTRRGRGRNPAAHHGPAGAGRPEVGRRLRG